MAIASRGTQPFSEYMDSPFYDGPGFPCFDDKRKAAP